MLYRLSDHSHQERLSLAWWRHHYPLWCHKGLFFFHYCVYTFLARLVFTFLSPIILYIDVSFKRLFFHLRVFLRARTVTTFFRRYSQHLNVTAAQSVVSLEADSPSATSNQKRTAAIHSFSFLVRQIECSSISEYSERIIKSNHLDSGKICGCLRSLHSDAGAPHPAAEGEGWVAGCIQSRCFALRLGGQGGTHHSILKCTIELMFYRRKHAPTHLTVFT